MTRLFRFDHPGSTMQCVESPLRALRPGEVRVRHRFCTICGSDLHTFLGRRSTPMPTVLGHETVGVVTELGSDEIKTIRGESLQIGDRIIWSVIRSCGQCFFCRREMSQKCLQLQKFGHEALSESLGPFGGLTEFSILPVGMSICKVPESLSDLVATPAMCATATVAAILRMAGDIHESTVLILGAGMLGLTASTMFREAGASTIFLVDRDPTRLSVAQRFSNPECYSVPEQDASLKRAIQQATENRGVDFVIELTGSTELTMQAIPLMRTGGSLLLAGAVYPTDPLSISPETIIRKWIGIQGIHNYAPVDLLSAIDFLARHHRNYPFHSLVEKVFPFSETNEAFAFAANEKPIRVGIRFE